MKNIYDILVEFGLEIPEEKKKDFDKALLENYRTKSDYDNVAAKRDEFKESLETTQGKLEKFKDIDVEDLKGQIATLTSDLQKEKDERAADTLKVEIEKNVDTFLNGKKFVNAITQESIRTKLMEELDKDTAKGKSIADIFISLISDKDGKQLENIIIDESQQHTEQNKATFTSKFNNSYAPGIAITKEDFKKMSLDERIKLKQENHELYESLMK